MAPVVAITEPDRIIIIIYRKAFELSPVLGGVLGLGGVFGEGGNFGLSLFVIT